MTKPTQAQIRAVAIAICKSKTCEGINCCQWPANGGKRRDRFGQPAQCNVKLGAYDDAAKAALTAAAEVGRDPDVVLEGTKEGFDLFRKSERNATIEHCAQVAASMEGQTYATGGAIAAAIRALKDKP